MIRVIDTTRRTYLIRCLKCEAVLEYELSDLRSRVELVDGRSRMYYGLECPACKAWVARTTARAPQSFPAVSK